MNRKPTFFWQGLLIVLPVLLLAAVGMGSLWKDREAVTLDAQTAAAQYGEQLAALLSAELHSELQRAANDGAAKPTGRSEGRVWPYGNQIDPEGNLLSVGPGGAPGDYRRIPAAEAAPADRLDSGAAELWAAARAVERVDHKAGIEAYDRFLATEPPEPFRANAQYARAVLLAATGEKDAALSRFRSLKGTPESTDTGLPLGLLVEFQRVKLLSANLRQLPSGARDELRSAVKNLCTLATERPSFATAPILSAAADLVADLDDEFTNRIHARQTTWQTDQNTRAFHRAVKPLLSTAPGAERSFWSNWNGRSRLVILTPSSHSPPVAHRPEAPLFEMHVYSESLVGEGVENLSMRPALRSPDFIQPAVYLQERLVSDAAAEGDSLATVDAEWTVNNTAVSGLQLSLRLADPDLLYAQQRQRALWFGALILIAAGAAVVGYAAARRAFHRQLHLNEMKNNFVASVSHELRAPIASVRLMAEGLERGAVPELEKQRDYFKFIVQECRRLSSLVENVLDFSRIEQGRREYDLEPTDLEALVRHTTDLMQPCALEHGVRIETKVSRTAPLIQAELDGKAIQQALVNLIDNAIKHSPRESAIVVGLTTGGDTPGSIVLSVEDSGEGIPAAEHERIFERFHRLGSELRRKTQGAGIGLSIVRHIVDAHGGKIRVQSKIGQGSRFEIEIPRGNADGDAPAGSGACNF